MSIVITGDDLQKLVNPKTGKEVINLLATLPPAEALLTLAVAQSSILGIVCSTADEATFTCDELARLTKDLLDKVYEAKLDQPNQLQ